MVTYVGLAQFTNQGLPGWGLHPLESATFSRRTGKRVGRDSQSCSAELKAEGFLVGDRGY